MGNAPIAVIAHRGLHTAAPENSLRSIAAAIEAGFDLIEVDVRAAADGDLFALHDARVDRTTGGSGHLRGKSAREVSMLRLRDGGPLPRLEALLDLCRKHALLCIDVKERDLGPAVVAAVRSARAEAEIWSTHPEVIARAADARIPPAFISLGLFRGGGLRAQIEFAAQLGAASVSFFPADVAPSTARACRSHGLGLMCGTPNDRPTWRRLAALRARAIITDDPLGCAATLGPPVRV
ncbi:MAG: glycerophosphodiester phosphodiesterase family protein [Dehalococcoidia bacterium]